MQHNQISLLRVSEPNEGCVDYTQPHGTKSEIGMRLSIQEITPTILRIQSILCEIFYREK